MENSKNITLNFRLLQVLKSKPSAVPVQSKNDVASVVYFATLATKFSVFVYVTKIPITGEGNISAVTYSPLIGMLCIIHEEKNQVSQQLINGGMFFRRIICAGQSCMIPKRIHTNPIFVSCLSTSCRLIVYRISAFICYVGNDWSHILYSFLDFGQMGTGTLRFTRHVFFLFFFCVSVLCLLLVIFLFYSVLVRFFIVFV